MFGRTISLMASLMIVVDPTEASVTVDGVGRYDDGIRLVDDRQEHSVEVRIPSPGP